MASDRIFGLVCLITAVAYLAAATQIQTNLFSGEFLPKLFPYLIGGTAAICSLTMMFRPDPEPDWPGAGSWINMGIAVVVLAIYAVLLTPLGFIERAAHVYPDHPALIYGDIQRTWAETYARCRQLASALSARGDWP